MPEPKKELKPGVKSTEFIVTLLIVVSGLLLSFGIVKDGSQAAGIVGFVGSVLAALGYTGVRGSLKRIEAVKDATVVDDPEDDS